MCINPKDRINTHVICQLQVPIIMLLTKHDVTVTLSWQDSSYSQVLSVLGESPYWHGPNTQLSDDVQVRARAWKLTSLPLADYIEKDIPIGKQSDAGRWC